MQQKHTRDYSKMKKKLNCEVNQHRQNDDNSLNKSDEVLRVDFVTWNFF